MKKISFSYLFIFLSGLLLNGQTTGELSISATTSTTGGKYAPKNILAIWIEDDAGNFVKTLLAYANKRKTHLNNWQSATTNAGSEFNTIDAISGATRSSHDTRKCTWDGTNYTGTIVPDGNYKVCMELTDKNSTGNYSSFPIKKDQNAYSQTPANKPSFASLSAQWVPVIINQDAEYKIIQMDSISINDTLITCSIFDSIKCIPPSGGELWLWTKNGYQDSMYVDTLILPINYEGEIHCQGNFGTKSLTILQFKVKKSKDITTTCGSAVQLEGGQTNYPNNALINYTWSPGLILNDSTIINPIASVTNNTQLEMKALAPNGCIAKDTVQIEMTSLATPGICMVSVDSSNHNMIVWEPTADAPYDSVFIYKETSQSGLYEVIGSQSAQKFPVFIDENSNPSQNSNRYKISKLDVCGFETSTSEYHKTMHLIINSGANGTWDLIWDKYEGFSYSTFNIYRGTSENNLLKIAEQAGNTFTYSDLAPPTGNVFYQVEVVNPNSCEIGDLKSTHNYYGSTRSNIVYSDQISSINENLTFNTVEIYPNPAHNKLYINAVFSNNYGIEIISQDGKIQMKYQNIKESREIDISTLQPGLYFLRLTNDKKAEYTKIIKK